jgi:glycosyltransferase involved in cell wall biosynthesis
MKFVNISKNTIYLDDIDKSIPYHEKEKEQEISLQEVKKSKNFRQACNLGLVKITEIGNSPLEKTLFKNNNTNQNTLPLEQNMKTIKPTGQLEVKLRGHFLEAGGYAKVNRNLALGLKDLGVNIAIEPIEKSLNDLTEEEYKKISYLKKNLSKEAIIIDSVVPTFGMVGGGKYKILYTTIESQTIPNQFLEAANCYHEVWVTSDFCKDVLKKHNYSRPIYVFPDTIDTNLYKEDVEPYEFNPPLKDFVFLSVFGWSYRKGYDALLKAYLSHFSENDPVSLLLISRYQSRNKANKIKEEIDSYIRKWGGENPPHIARCSKVIPEHKMPQVYKASDAFVLLSRGEGFGLIYCESSLCGLPVIATNFSGHTMFLKKDNSYLIDIDDLKKIPEGTMHIHYWDNQEFPCLNSKAFIDQAGKTMREVFENNEKAKKKNKALQSFIAENYNVPKVCSDIKKRLETIWKNKK